MPLVDELREIASANEGDNWEHLSDIQVSTIRAAAEMLEWQAAVIRVYLEYQTSFIISGDYVE